MFGQAVRAALIIYSQFLTGIPHINQKTSAAFRQVEQ
jgi:hypothetical protein